MAYFSRLGQLREAMRKGYRVIVTERSVLCDKFVFAKMLYDDGKIESVQWDIYNEWFHAGLQDFPPIQLLYLRTSPEVANSRVHERGRPGENIPFEYLQN